MSFPDYKRFYQRSLNDPESFWGEQAQSVHWNRPWEKVLDYSSPPFARWFVGGETNLCYNAVDRHLEARGEQVALVYISTETQEQREYTYRELYTEVNRFAAILKDLGVGKGDRVVIYMPMMPEAIFAMLACVRLGAVHSVVFGGFAAENLATRIDDARPKIMVTTDAGMRGGKVIPYGPMVNKALDAAEHPPERVLICDRGLDDAAPPVEDRDVVYATLGERHMDAEVPVEWLESNEPSYILYTSGTTGTPKGVQRDTGGYAVALAASMRNIFGGEPGETMFTASDIGWVVGHSYTTYAPLLHGMTTVVYEGLPVRPDPGIWWKIVEDHGVTVMFTAPTAIRALRKQDQKYIDEHDLSSLRYLFLAGEPLDVPTGEWVEESLGVTVADNYWQTETGWPILSNRLPGVEPDDIPAGAAGLPCYGYDLKLVDEMSGEEVGADHKGVLTIQAPLPPGCMSTVWGDDERFIEEYFSNFRDQLYSTSDYATRDEEGYYLILGRADDVINVSGHRLGTREIEEAISAHEKVAEAATIGMKDEEKGQIVVAYVVPQDGDAIESEDESSELEQSIKDTVANRIGAVARPSVVHLVGALPKTRSGKLLRRSIQAVAEGEDPGDLSTLEDPSALEDIRTASEKR